MNGILVINGMEYNLEDLRAFNIVYGVSPEIDIVIDLKLGEVPAVAADPTPEEEGGAKGTTVVAEGVGRPSVIGIYGAFELETMLLIDVMAADRLQELMDKHGPQYLPMDMEVESQRIRKEARRQGIRDLRTKYYMLRPPGTADPLDLAVKELLAAEKLAMQDIGGQYGRTGSRTVVFNKDKSKFRMLEEDFEVWRLPEPAEKEPVKNEEPKIS